MQLRSVSHLEVLDLQHPANKRPPKTLLGLRLDGEAINGLVLRGEVKPGSGDNTIAAFEEGDSPSLLAWIDPVSGECFHVWHPSTAQSIAALLAGVFCFYLFPEWDSFVLWQQITFSLPLVGGACWFLLTPGIKKRNLENALHKKYQECFGALNAPKKPTV